LEVISKVSFLNRFFLPVT